MHVRLGVKSILTMLFGVVVCAASLCFGGQPKTDRVTLSSDEIKQRSAEIDRLVLKGLAEKELNPLPLTNDDQFVRRIYLDIVGRIPTLAETRDYSNCREPDKRSLYIKSLLNSPGHVSHFFNFWADILRIKDADAAISRAFYINWVKESLAANKPYDQFVRDLLTSSGCGWERGNGAVGYYLRDRGMPLDNMANTLRIFAGTRLACAQCHNHPNDRWTRRQFFEMAAFTNGLRTDNRDELFRDIYQREKTTTNEDLRAFSQYIRNTFRADKVLGTSDGTIHLPADYQYDDAKGSEVITAHPIFGPEEPIQESDSPVDYRQRFADWLTSPENERFTSVIANRLWKYAMGRGLVDPVDDWRDDNQPSNSELLDYLTQLMKDVRYDMRLYLQVIYNSQSYQRTADPNEPIDDVRASCCRRPLTRMSAEQVWDSLMTLIVPDIDTRQSGFYDTRIYYGGHPVLVGKEDMYSRYEAVKDHDLDQHWDYLTKQLKAMQDDLQTQAESGAIDADDVGRGFYRRPHSEGVLVRAAELRSPAEPSHFLRTFGQSNRELIEGANSASNVTQFLSMFNGIIESQLLQNPDCELMKHVNAADSFSQKCDVIFLSVLSRAPTEEERSLINAMHETDQNQRLQNLIWALVNSQEFIFVQ